MFIDQFTVLKHGKAGIESIKSSKETGLAFVYFRFIYLFTHALASAESAATRIFLSFSIKFKTKSVFELSQT
jgi:hypothetical protein